MVLDAGRGHIRIDTDGQCAMTAVDTGPALDLWMYSGVTLDATGARELARLLNRWADKRAAQ